MKKYLIKFSVEFSYVDKSDPHIEYGQYEMDGKSPEDVADKLDEYVHDRDRMESDFVDLPDDPDWEMASLEINEIRELV